MHFNSRYEISASLTLNEDDEMVDIQAVKKVHDFDLKQNSILVLCLGWLAADEPNM